MFMKRPHWPLERVKELARGDRTLHVQWSRARDFFDSQEEAYAAVRNVLQALTLKDFAHTVELTWDVADVYGKQVEEQGWYIKLTIDESQPEVAIISFHPLERPLKTNGGLINP